MKAEKLVNLMAQDNYEFWKKILIGKDISSDFLIYLENNVSSVLVIEYVRLGLQKGILPEYIKLYSKETYNQFQLKTILEGLEFCQNNEALVNLVKHFCNSKLSHWHMDIVLDGIKQGFTEEQIIALSRPILYNDEPREKYKEYLIANRSKHLSELISTY